MELYRYLQIGLKHWRIVVLAFLVTFIAALLLTLRQAPVYSTSTTYVVSPSNALRDARSILSGLDSLTGKSQVANTYCEIAASQVVKRKAAEILGIPLSEVGIPSRATAVLSVGCKLRASTNVIEITVQAPDPNLAADYANEISQGTMDYVANLYEVYDLKPLDVATPPTSPIKPNKKLNLAVAGVLGLALGFGMAFVANYLQGLNLFGWPEKSKKRRPAAQVSAAMTRVGVDNKEMASIDG